METPQFKDGRSEKVYRRLHLLGPGPAAFFADTYRLMEQEIHLATRSHMVGHLLRELEGSVRGPWAISMNRRFSPLLEPPEDFRGDALRVEILRVVNPRHEVRVVDERLVPETPDLGRKLLIPFP